MIAALFLAATCLGLAALCTVCLHKVPVITGSLALIVTLAALAAAIPH